MAIFNSYVSHYQMVTMTAVAAVAAVAAPGRLLPARRWGVRWSAQGETVETLQVKQGETVEKWGHHGPSLVTIYPLVI